VVAGYYTGDSDEQPPYTEVRTRGVLQPTEPVRIAGFLDIPRASAPGAGERLPADRVLHWSMAGPAPDFYFIVIVGGNGVPAWTQVVPGTQTQRDLDLRSIPVG
jgi:hypothetical protein